MTISNAHAHVLSFTDLTAKVVAFGGFVERMPGGQKFDRREPYDHNMRPGNDEFGVSPSATNAVQEAYDLGYAEGYAKAEAELRAVVIDMRALLSQAQALQAEPTAEIVHMIGDLVERIVTQICGSMPVTREWLVHQIDHALPYVEQCSQSQTLWLHPDDAALIKDVTLPIDVQTDPLLPRATVQIRSSKGYLESGISPFIAQMHDALDLNEVRG